MTTYICDHCGEEDLKENEVLMLCKTCQETQLKKAQDIINEVD